MKKVLEIFLFSLVVFGLLTLFSCSPEEIIGEEFTPTSFEEDPLYGTLNDNSTVEDYIEVFLKDAKRHGIDYTDLIESVEVVWELHPMFGGVADGGTLNANDPFNIKIIILKETWDSLNFDGTFKDGRVVPKSVYFGPDKYIPYYKLKLIYHELGHDVLGYDHTCEPGHLMTGNEPCGRVWGELADGDFDGGLYNMATLRYQHEEELRVWDRAVDDLFNSNGQIFLPNRNSFFD